MIRISAVTGLAFAFALAVTLPVTHARAADTVETPHKVLTTPHHKKNYHHLSQRKRPGAGTTTGSQAGTAPAAAKNYPATNSPSAPTGH